MISVFFKDCARLFLVLFVVCVLVVVLRCKPRLYLAHSVWYECRMSISSWNGTKAKETQRACGACSLQSKSNSETRFYNSICSNEKSHINSSRRRWDERSEVNKHSACTSSTSYLYSIVQCTTHQTNTSNGTANLALFRISRFKLEPAWRMWSGTYTHKKTAYETLCTCVIYTYVNSMTT